MDTNIPLNHTLLVFNISFSDFGDKETVGDPAVIKAALENTDGYENDAYSDDTVSTITCQILPSDPFFVEKKGKLQGLVAQFNRYGAPVTGDWYKIASVRPGESLYDSTPDFVELTLTKIVPREPVGVDE